MIRVLIVNEIRLMCNVIASVLEEEDDIDVIGSATTLDEALERAAESDVILISTHLPDQGALRLTRSTIQDGLATKVLVLGLAESEGEIMQYVEAGAAGYVLQDDSVDELLRNVRAAANDEAVVSPEIAGALIARVTELAQIFGETEPTPHAVTELTDRERQILALIREDLTNREIAERLVIEVGTVKNHVHNILNKLNVTSRHEAAAFWNLIEH
ncbi:MAG: LuxR C-terminal-related transcriptional regulator [Anaerolineae bacterium]